MAADPSSIIETLEGALAKGVLSARDGDMSFQFRSVSELKDAIAYWRVQLAAQTGGTTPQHSVVMFERS